MLVIRPATSADLLAICEMVRLLALHHNDNATLTPADLQRDAFGARPWLDLIVAAHEDKPVGYCALTRRVQLAFAKRAMDMHHLFVAADWRGKGVGGALVQAAFALAQAENCALLTVSTHPDNLAAQAFYPKHGFVRAGDAESAPRFWADITD